MNTSNNQQSRQPRVIYVEATIIGILRIRMFRIVIRVYEVRISLICCIDSRCVESRARETVLCHTQLKLSTGYCVMLRSRTPSPHGGWGARDAWRVCDRLHLSCIKRCTALPWRRNAASRVLLFGWYTPMLFASGVRAAYIQQHRLIRRVEEC